MSTTDRQAERETERELTVSSHRRDRESKLERDKRRTFVKRAIEEGYHLLQLGRVDELSDVLRALVLRLGIESDSLDRPTTELPEGHEFHLHELREFARRVQAGVSPSPVLREIAGNSTKSETELEAAENVLESILTFAVVGSYLPDGLEDTQPVLGYQSQLGERYVRPDSQATGTLTLRDTDEELKSILCAGGKGSGKSTAVESLALDSWQNGHKVVDLVDFFKGENTVYDIPQQDNGEGLIEMREEMDLPTGFDDLDEAPRVEILIPLCPGLEEMRIPAIGGEEPVVRPFTIPASDLTYRQLVMLLHHTTTARENELRSAHQVLRDSGKDWTLADVAEEVKRSTNASEKLANDIETSLRMAQKKSFIRDKECPHALDWSDVMQDGNTITAFTVHPIQETADHLVVLSYLIDSLFEARKKLLTRQLLTEFPPLTVVMREMHKVAPRSTAEQSAESTVEKYMIDSLEDMFALTRHANMEVLGDTQKFYRQLAPEVSGLFDQILAFRGHVPDVKHIFRTRVDDTTYAEKVAQYDDPGRCAFISEEGFRLPIQFAPPRCHHLEAKQEGSGLGFRTKVPETDEELIDSPWNAELPERLGFDDLPDHPIEQFLEQHVHVVDDRDEYILTKDLYRAYCEWADENDAPGFERTKVTRRLTRYYDDIGSNTLYQPVINGEQERAHRRVMLDWKLD